MKYSKECKKHGILSQENIIVEKSKLNKNGLAIRCRLCKVEKDRRWKSNHKEQHIATSTRWKKENKEHYSQWQKEDRKKHPEKYKRYEDNYLKKYGIEHLRRTEVLRVHGLTKEQYDAMIKSQVNKCAICNKEETRAGRTKGTITPLSIDHCHVCELEGKYCIRGLLCHACNTAIGKFKDDINLLKNAILYLEKHACK